MQSYLYQEYLLSDIDNFENILAYTTLHYDI